jgi:colanic acid/amylovoran biosynthesis glycosyltransferase
MFKLIIVGVSWPPETFLQRKIEGLQRRGIDLTIAIHMTRRKFVKGISGIRIVRLPHHKDPVLLRLFQLINLHLRTILLPSGWAKIKKIWSYSSKKSLKLRFNFLLQAFSLSKLSPDLVHFEWPSAALSYSYMSEIWKCPMTLSLRGSQINIDPCIPGNEKYLQDLHEIFVQSKAVHCVSEAIQKKAQLYGLDVTKARIIRPAVDPSFFIPCETSKPQRGSFQVITTGSLIWRKGYEYALMTIQKLKAAGVPVKYQIIGDGPERQRILYTIHDLGVENEVVILGKRTPEQVRDALQVADVFMLSSLSEGISNAALEAMACSLPVVTTDCGGMREAVRDNVEGFVVPVRDWIAMANAIETLWHSPELQCRMGKAGRERILHEFQLEQQVDEFMRFYKAVL